MSLTAPGLVLSKSQQICYWLPLWRYQVQTHGLTEAKNWYAQNRDCEEYGNLVFFSCCFVVALFCFLFLKQWHTWPRLYCLSKTSRQLLFLVVTGAWRCALQDECTVRSLYMKAKVMLWSTVATTLFSRSPFVSWPPVVSPKPLLKELTANGLRVDWPRPVKVHHLEQIVFFLYNKLKAFFFLNYCLLFKAGKTMAAKGFPDDVMCST